MKQAVRDAFPAFTDRFEGRVGWMYCDVLGLVTTGRGNLIDPKPAAMGLPWRNRDGALAGQAQVSREWDTVKSLQAMRVRGGYAYADCTNLRLTPQAIDDLTCAKLDEMWSHLLGRFPDAEAWPADAQLGLLSMAWAMGPAFHFPAFASAALAQDFATCADQCKMREEGNPGLIPRNQANRTLFNNAARSHDPETLFYPSVLA